MEMYNILTQIHYTLVYFTTGIINLVDVDATPYRCSDWNYVPTFLLRSSIKCKIYTAYDYDYDWGWFKLKQHSLDQRNSLSESQITEWHCNSKKSKSIYLAPYYFHVNIPWMHLHIDCILHFTLSVSLHWVGHIFFFLSRNVLCLTFLFSFSISITTSCTSL